MQNAITSQTAHKKYRGSGIGSGTGTSSISNIEVNTEYPLVSFITMIAPSPDWFVGVHDFNLCDTTTGKWKEARTRDLPPYDAGTDSGPRFQSRNLATNPPEDIHLLTNNTGGSFKSDKPVKRFGTFTFIKTYDSNPVIEPSSTMQVQPSANATHSTIMTDPKGSSTHHEDTKITLSANPTSSTMQIQPSPNATHSAIMTDPKGSSTHHEDTKITLSANHNVPSTHHEDTKITLSANPTSSTMQIQPSANATHSAIMTDPKGSSTHHEGTKVTLSANPNVPSTHHEDTKITLSANPTSSSMQIQPSANATHSVIVTDPKRSSTHHEDTKITLSANASVPSTHHEDTKITLSANPNVPSQTVSPTATVTASASVQMTPTTNTTSAACSVKQVGFTHVVFAMILVNFCL